MPAALITCGRRYRETKPAASHSIRFCGPYDGAVPLRAGRLFHSVSSRHQRFPVCRRVRCGWRAAASIPLGRRAQIAIAHDVVSLKHGWRLVASQPHRHALGDTGTNEIANRRAAQIVRNPAGHARGHACDLPRLVEFQDRFWLLSPPRFSATMRKNTHGSICPIFFSRSCSAYCAISTSRSSDVKEKSFLRCFLCCRRPGESCRLSVGPALTVPENLSAAIAG